MNADILTDDDGDYDPRDKFGTPADQLEETYCFGSDADSVESLEDFLDGLELGEGEG